MTKNIFVSVLAAVFFFVGAGVVFISANGFERGGVLSSAKKKFSPNAAPSSGASRQYRFDNNRPGAAAKKQNRKRSWRPKKIINAIREFANQRIGLRYISANLKDSLSLVFSLIGTFFTWRSYRIQKAAHRRND